MIAAAMHVISQPVPARGLRRSQAGGGKYARQRREQAGNDERAIAHALYRYAAHAGRFAVSAYGQQRTPKGGILEHEVDHNRQNQRYVDAPGNAEKAEAADGVKIAGKAGDGFALRHHVAKSAAMYCVPMVAMNAGQPRSD